MSKPAQGAALIMQKFQRMIQENSIKPAENQNVGGIPGLGFEALPKSETKGKSPGFNQVLASFILRCNSQQVLDVMSELQKVWNGNIQ